MIYHQHIKENKVKYIGENNRSERKANREQLNRKAKKSFRKYFIEYKDKNNIIRREKRKQKLIDKSEFLNTGTE